MRAQELETLPLFVVFLLSQHVDEANPAELRRDISKLRSQLLCLAAGRLDFCYELVERAAPLILQPLATPLQTRLNL